MNILHAPLFLLVFVSACSMELPGEFKRFSPPPLEYERWEKTGTTSIEVQKALLECGLPEPFGNIKKFAVEDVNLRRELVAKVQLCMRTDGFKLYEDLKYVCDGASDLKNCGLGMSVPKRDPEIRLNSVFCKDPIYGKNKTCQP